LPVARADGLCVGAFVMIVCGCKVVNENVVTLILLGQICDDHNSNRSDEYKIYLMTLFATTKHPNMTQDELLFAYEAGKLTQDNPCDHAQHQALRALDMQIREAAFKGLRVVEFHILPGVSYDGLHNKLTSHGYNINYIKEEFMVIKW
jgi:hypothetical protein